jgi:hypothetical protein
LSVCFFRAAFFPQLTTDNGELASILSKLFHKWPKNRVTKENARERNMYAAAAVKNNPFAGHVPAVFKSVTPAWKRICGD